MLELRIVKATPEECWQSLRNEFMEKGNKIPKIFLIYATYEEYEHDFICNERMDECRYVPVKIMPYKYHCAVYTESRLLY